MEQVGKWVSGQTEATNVVPFCFVITAVSYEQASYDTQQSRFFRQDIYVFIKVAVNLSKRKTPAQCFSLNFIIFS